MIYSGEINYEKKYKEALEKARKTLEKSSAKDEAKLVVEYFFPELAESNDERIRKYLIEELKATKSVGELKFIIPQPTREECIAYLEKQKDASYAIKAVDRIDKYIDEHLANAHDMKDSNPDKKYYRGWDDALGKMAGILQDVYSDEKQKEQKPNIELIQRSWYMEGYHDREFGKEPKWVIKTGEGGPKHELNPRYGEPLCDEQKPAESRKRNRPKESWLSRAKYEIEHADELLKQRQEELREIRELKNKEQHPSTKFRPGDWVVYDGPLGHAILQIEDVVGGRYTFVDNDSTLLEEDSNKFLRPLTPKDVERPAEWSDTDNIGWDEAFACVTRAEKSAKNEEELQNAVTAEKWLKEIKFKYYVHPVKQEWDEFDRDCLKRAIWYVENPAPTVVKDTNLVLWLQSIPERFNLQPKEEWSDEDKDMLNSCISSIEEAKENRYAYKETDGDTSYDHEIAWLKSLRPFWKPSEEQMSMLLAVINDPNNAGAESCYMALKSIYNQLKKL